jgi:hypothetical protein
VRTCIVPMEPEAPTRLSGRSWHCRGTSRVLREQRPERSESPPAPKGITSVIGLEGMAAQA